jgi:asparagine synthetase B (glutamine-hydrolysing)
MVWHMEEPIGREDIAYLYVAAREAARHVELVLTGFGFDGLFAGLPRHRVADVALKVPPLAGPLREFYDYSVRGIQPKSIPGRALKALYFRGKDFPAPEVIGAGPLAPLDGFGSGKDQPLSQFLRKGFLMLPYQSVVERLYTAVGVRVNAHHTDPAFLRAAFSIPDRLKIKGRT